MRIFVRSDQDLHDKAAEYGFTGSGTKDDPYVLEGKSFKEEDLIWIHETTSHIHIRDCTFITGTPYNIQLKLYKCNNIIIQRCKFVTGKIQEGYDLACEMVECKNCAIVECEFKGNPSAVRLELCQDVTVSENKFLDNTYGLRIVDCSLVDVARNLFTSGIHAIQIAWSTTSNVFSTKLRILDNTIQAMYDDGIVLRGVWDLTVDGNYIYSDKNGIFATSARRLSIHHNQIESREHGVRIESGGDLDISDNRLIAYGGSAIGLSKVSNFNVRNNLCVSEKGRAVGKLGGDGIYLENSQDGTIDGNKYAGEGTRLFWEGIRMVNSTRIKALNNDVRALWSGIYIHSCKSEDSPCVLSQNKCTTTKAGGPYSINGSSGIAVSDSVGVEIIKNECNECDKGIEISESQKITAADNVCVQNDMVGIYLKSSNHCVLENNECALNGSTVLFSEAPRSAESSCTGISVLFSGNITIRKNKCYNNADHGILLYSCKQCTIEGNSCSKNGTSGIALASTNDSKLIKNYCKDNGLVGIHLSSSCNGAVVRNNVCTGHGKFGIEALGVNISILYNKCTDNQYKGIRVADDPERHGITLYKNRE